MLSAGLAVEKSSRATNMVYTQMLFALAFDKLIFGTNPGFLSIVGSSLILGSALYVSVQKANSPPNGQNKEEADDSDSAAAAVDEERGLVAGMGDGYREIELVSAVDREQVVGVVEGLPLGILRV
jgi:hypothetical protein